MHRQPAGSVTGACCQLGISCVPGFLHSAGGGGCDHHDKGSGGSSGWKTFFILALVTGALGWLVGPLPTLRAVPTAAAAVASNPPCLHSPALLATAGILLTLGGVVWAHLLPAGLKEDIAAKAGPALGAAGAVLGALFEKVLDLVITAWDWARAKLGGVLHWGCCAARQGALLGRLAATGDRSHQLV